MGKVLLAADLDRTVLPNGEQPESPGARSIFSKLTAREEIILVYVSGRNKYLLVEAINNFDIPIPAYAISDVGTTIYQPTAEGDFLPLQEWEEKIAADWRGKDWTEIKELFTDVPLITLQEQEMQNKFKVSYYAPENTDSEKILNIMQEKAEEADVSLSLIWSIDEQKNTGLLDVLPKSATKIGALEFLREKLKIAREQTVFCGDSGNDIPALTSGLNAVMVKNAREEIQERVKKIAAEKGIMDKIYTAKGGFKNLNGNYSAGVIEGVVHFFPQIENWL